MDGVVDEQDFDDLVEDPMMEEFDEDDKTYTKRRSRTTLPRTGVPYIRRSHDMGVKYSTLTKSKAIHRDEDECDAWKCYKFHRNDMY
jgi:hypothetical protein